jgi:hypothetical protein
MTMRVRRPVLYTLDMTMRVRRPAPLWGLEDLGLGLEQGEGVLYDRGVGDVGGRQQLGAVLGACDPQHLPRPVRVSALGLMVCWFDGLMVCWFVGLMVWGLGFEVLGVSGSGSGLGFRVPSDLLTWGRYRAIQNHIFRVLGLEFGAGRRTARDK